MSAGIEWQAASSLFDDADRLEIARLAPDAQDIERFYIEATVALIWPYSSSTQRLSLLLAESDVRLRKSKGQVKITIHGACAREVAKTRIGIGDSVKLGLQDITWSKTGEQVSTPGKKVDWDLVIRKRIQLEIRQGDSAPIVINHVASSPSPNVEGSMVEIVGPKSNGFIKIRKAQLPSSSPLPAQRKYDRNSSGSFADATLDPFANDDGYIVGRGRKRTKFARYSGDWQLLDGEEADSKQHDQTIPSSPLERRADATPSSTTVPSRNGMIDSELDSIVNGQMVAENEIESFTSVQQDNQTIATELEPPHPGNSTGNQDGLMAPPPVPSPVIQRQQTSLAIPNNHQSAMAPTPVLQPLLSPGLAMVSPLVARSGVMTGYFPDVIDGQSELDAISHSPSDPQAEAGPMLTFQQTEIIESKPQQSESEPGSELKEVSPRQAFAAIEDNTGAASENLLMGLGQVYKPTHDLLPINIDADQSFVSYPEVPYLIVPDSNEVDLDALQQQIEESSSQWLRPVPVLLEDEDMYGPPVQPDVIDPSAKARDIVNDLTSMHQEQFSAPSTPHPATTEHMGFGSHPSGTKVRPPEMAVAIASTSDKDNAESDTSHERERSIPVSSGRPTDLESQLEEALEEEDNDNVQHDDSTNSEHAELVASPTQSRRKSSSSVDIEWMEHQNNEDREHARFLASCIQPRRNSSSSVDVEWMGDQNDEDREHAGFLSSLIEQRRTSTPSEESAQKPASTGSGDSSTSKSLSQHDGSDEPYESEEQRLKSRIEAEFVNDTGSAGADDAVNTFLDLSPTLIQKDEALSSSIYASGSEEDSESIVSDGSGDEPTNAPSIIAADTGLISRQPEHIHNNSAAPVDEVDREDAESLKVQTHSIRLEEVRHLLTPNATQQTGMHFEDGLPIASELHVQLPPSPHLTQENILYTDPSLNPPRQDSVADDEPALPMMANETIREVPAVSRRLSRKSFTHGLISTDYFTPRRSTRQAQSSPTLVPEPIVEVRQATSPIKPRRGLRSSSPVLVLQAEEARTQPSKPVRGITTPLSYFPFLSTLREYFNLQVDILAVATADSFIPLKAKSGPKDYYTVMCLADPSFGDNTTIRAEIFRPRKAALPLASRGDVVLLRNMKVQTNEHKVMLLSASSSAWAIFKQSSGKLLDVDVKGPPVEYDEHEWAEADRLVNWWLTNGEIQYPDLPDTSDVTEIARQTRPESPRITRSQRRKLNLTDHFGNSQEPHHDDGSDEHEHTGSVAESMVPGDSQGATSPSVSSRTNQNPSMHMSSSPPVSRKQRAHRRTRSDLSQTFVHELRDGTQYMDEDGSRGRSVSVIHELRDGYTYIDE